MFVSTIPFRISMDYSKSFVEFVQTISKSSFSIFRHQSYPYQYLLENLRKENSSVPNLYDVMISYQNMRSNASSSDINFESKWTNANYISTEINIHFFDINNDNILDIGYDYQVDKYSEEDIVALHERILHMFEQVLKNNEIELKNVEIVTESEKHQILYDFNNTKTDYPKDKTIVELFEEQVNKNPNNIAVVFEDQKLTYKELDEKSNQLGNYLIERGVKKEEIIATFLNKSLESIVSLLSILKVGCAYLPIDIEYPQERICFMLKDSNVKIVLTTNNLFNKLPSNFNLVETKLDNSIVYSNNNKFYSVLGNAKDLAYVMYTSGSTGNPKGVMITQRNVVRLVKNPNYIDFGKSEKILQTGSIVFDACTFEIWGALLNGFELYVIKKEDLLDPVAFEKYLNKNKISILWLTSPLFNQLSENNPNMFDSVKYLLTGGDVLSPVHINSVKNCCPNLKIINGYGPTENTTFSTCFSINKTYENAIPIGYPISNSTCYVCSRNLNLLPVGVPGELVVGGDGVGKGYLNNTDFSSKKFVQSPFESGISYRTGDLVKWFPDGSIDFIGRIDNQVKIRGFRVELSEISLKMQEYPNIKECISIVKSINNEKVICSYFSSNEEINISELKSFLKNSLPYYAIPSYFTQLSVLPIKQSGKIDISKLPIPEISVNNQDIILPRNNIDKTILKIFKSILNVKKISIDNSFFELGGDSLSAINLCSQLSKEFSISISVKDILENPTILSLSDKISSLITTSIIVKNISPVVLSTSYPTSSAQKRIYLSSLVAGENSTIYNISGGIILDKTIDVEKLEKCLKALVDRHESLRTYFEMKNENIVQKIKENIDFKLGKITSEKDDLEVIYKNFVKPFDLSKAPLFRAELVQLPNNKCAILIDIHHIISDGTSMSILINELCKLYNAETLATLNITYKDFSSFESAELSSGNLNSSKEFWLKQFEGELPVLNMPLNFARPAVQSFDGKKVYFNIDKDLTNSINEKARELGITPYMLLLATYYVLLYKYTSQDDIIVGSPIVGRNLADTYNVIGMFVNTLALRSKIDSNLSFKNYLDSIKTLCLNAYEHQTYPFDELVNKLNIKRDTSRSPLFDTMFIYQNNGNPSVKFDGINSEYYIPDSNISKFDLSLEIIPNEEELNLSFEYCTKLFEDRFIEALSSHYTNILKTVVDNIDVPIKNIDMLSTDERNTILYEFNNTKFDYPKDKTITQLFEEQVKKTPNNIAIVFEDQKMTYKELNEKANSLATYLRENGIGRNDIVPIMLNRSIDLIISIFGIIKSGAAYLPISTEYPIDRINYIISDCGSNIIITSSSHKQITENLKRNINYLFIDTFVFTNYSRKNIKKVNSFNDLLYIIYTSGSTGNPKGVKICHYNLNNFIHSMTDLFGGIKDINRCLASTNISFDVSVFEIFISLLNGVTLYLYEENSITDIFNYCNKIIENKISLLYIPPNILEDVFKILSTKKHSYIKKLLLGVEPIRSSTIKKYYSLNPNIKIVNAYGPTETTICSTGVLLTNTILNKYKIVPIGKPLSNLSLYVLDKDYNIVPENVSGELFISGDNVGSGYLNKNSLTSSSFVNIPKFCSSPLYKTGDMVKWNIDGTLSFVSRKDFQVKINGHRIELGEIETILTSYPDIKKSIVLLNERNKLVAFFTCNKTFSISDLKAFLQLKLPVYFMPNFFVPLKNFTLTSNGKIDRKALLEIPLDTSNNYEEPHNNYQKSLVSLFESVLSIKKVGINDNFFELGGDSLTAIKLQIEAFNNKITLSYKDIFKYPTVKQLSENISDLNNNLTGFNEIYDYSKIDKLLSKNIYSSKIKYKKTKIKNILLTGSTGYVGSHVLDNLLKDTKCNIYCLIRSKNNSKPKSRLLDTLNFYFGKKYNKMVSKRIFILEGDITKQNLGLSDESYEELGKKISCIINSAAIVKHYGDNSIFDATNIDGTQNIINFCTNFNCKLVHLSTLSVSGNIFDTSKYTVADLPTNTIFTETKLFINQDLSNTYIRSKFTAERLILENIIKNNLNAKVIRLGNITNRYSDGTFQFNLSENAFLNRITSILQIGLIPEYLVNSYTEFTPVDYCAKAIVKLSLFDSDFSVFHVYNNNHITFKNLIEILSNLKVDLKVVSFEEFNNKIQELSNDNSNKHILSGIINDFGDDKKLNYKSNISISNNFTNKILAKLSFKWPKINKSYISKYINYLKSIGYLK